MMRKIFEWLGFLPTVSSDREQEEIRQIKDDFLKLRSDQQILMIAMARFMESEGCDDQKLIDELYRRGRSK
jgi:hypothetical protein